MARQSNTPVQFQSSARVDSFVTMTSGRAGRVYPVAYFPLLRGDSASGACEIELDLAPMPRPLLNGVMVNVQAWFVSKHAHPQFTGLDEFMASYQGTEIKSPSGTRTPPSFFTAITDPTDLVTIKQSEFFKTLGIHIPAGKPVHTDLIDAFNLIYNFRLAANSKSLPLKSFTFQDLDEALELPRAFWPSGPLRDVVPDYERALLVGSLDLDVQAGQIPIHAAATVYSGTGPTWAPASSTAPTGTAPDLSFDVNQVWTEFSGQAITTSLADIDKARTTQAFARLRAAYAGNDFTGYDLDDTIVAELMQGLSVPPDAFGRPVLLDSKRVPIGFTERFATNDVALDASISEGRTMARLSLNVPRSNEGGLVIVTCEVVPERVNERMSDEWLSVTQVSELPDALRDIQIVEPVEYVYNRQVDAAHVAPDGVYGFQPMNNKWNRTGQRLGGAFYQSDPTNPFMEQRAGLWHSSIVNPTLSVEHYLCPAEFPHDVFSDTLSHAWEATVRHNVTIVGLTQIGDVLMENSDDYEAVASEVE